MFIWKAVWTCRWLVAREDLLEETFVFFRVRLEANSPCHWYDEWFIDVRTLGFFRTRVEVAKGSGSEKILLEETLVFSCKGWRQTP